MKLTTPTRLLALLFLSSLASCKSMLTTWHDKSYVPIVDLSSSLIERSGGDVEWRVADDLAAAADKLYAEGHVLVGYSKFTHTLIPNFNGMYARMYGEKLGASVVMQETPRQDGDVYAYTVTYWAKGKDFPLGAYYNDMPDEARMYFPDSLREHVGKGNRPVLVESVVMGTTADEAGVAKGELIVRIDGESIDGAEDLDARIMEREGRRATLDVWGLDGLRTVEVSLGAMARNPDMPVPGAEALYYAQPWALEEYQDFAWISHAFQDAVNQAVADYNRLQEEERRRAHEAWQDYQLSSMQSELDGLDPRDSRRRGDSRSTGRLGISDLRHQAGTDIDWNGHFDDWQYTHQGFTGMYAIRPISW
jgi:hypothetical protein